jgi:hypothetical protein
MMDLGYFEVGFDARMRQNRRNFRVMHEMNKKPRRVNQVMGIVMEQKYSTKMRDGTVVDGHDDWSCIQDMHAAGFFDIIDQKRMIIKDAEVEPCARLVLTEKGEFYSNALRKHKRNGGNWRGFKVPVVEEVS